MTTRSVLKVDLDDPKLKGLLGEILAKHALERAGYVISSGREVADYLEAYLALRGLEVECRAEVRARGVFEVLLPQISIGWTPKAKIYVKDGDVIISSVRIPGSARIDKDLPNMELVQCAYAKAKELTLASLPSAILARRLAELISEGELMRLVHDLRMADLVGLEGEGVVVFEVKAGGSVSHAQISRAKKLKDFKLRTVLVEIEIPCRPLVKLSRRPFG